MKRSRKKRFQSKSPRGKTILRLPMHFRPGKHLEFRLPAAVSADNAHDALYGKLRQLQT
jgi:hypothetical protein